MNNNELLDLAFQDFKHQISNSRKSKRGKFKGERDKEKVKRRKVKENGRKEKGQRRKFKGESSKEKSIGIINLSFFISNSQISLIFVDSNSEEGSILCFLLISHCL